MVEWMRWSDRKKVRISDRTLLWLCENGMEQWRMQVILSKMSPEKAMNYIERQCRESYKGKKAKEVASQYADYLNTVSYTQLDVYKRQHGGGEERLTADERSGFESRRRHYRCATVSNMYKQAFIDFTGGAL